MIRISDAGWAPHGTMAGDVSVDEFISTHEPEWARLRKLARRRRLRPDEIDELVERYERVSTHAAMARRFADRELTGRLSRLTAEAAAAVYGTRPRRWAAVRDFVVDTFPAALWHIRGAVAIAAAVFLVPAIALAVWVATTPEALEALGTEEFRQAYVDERFVEYYTEMDSTVFFALVTTNNVQVGVLAFALGILAVVPTLSVLVANGLNLGVAAGLFGAVGDLRTLLVYLTPHGLLELTAVFIAGGAGLRLGWSWIDPGDRTRSGSLAIEAQRAMVVVVGLFAVFGVAGAIEGYVTGAESLPPWLRIGVGAAALAVFVVYVAACGSRAAKRGLTGALAEQRRDHGVRRLHG